MRILLRWSHIITIIGKISALPHIMVSAVHVSTCMMIAYVIFVAKFGTMMEHEALLSKQSFIRYGCTDYA